MVRWICEGEMLLLGACAHPGWPVKPSLLFSGPACVNSPYKLLMSDLFAWLPSRLANTHGRTPNAFSVVTSFPCVFRTQTAVKLHNTIKCWKKYFWYITHLLLDWFLDIVRLKIFYWCQFFHIPYIQFLKSILINGLRKYAVTSVGFLKCNPKPSHWILEASQYWGIHEDTGISKWIQWVLKGTKSVRESWGTTGKVGRKRMEWFWSKCIWIIRFSKGKDY